MFYFEFRNQTTWMTVTDLVEVSLSASSLKKIEFLTVVNI